MQKHTKRTYYTEKYFTPKIKIQSRSHKREFFTSFRRIRAGILKTALQSLLEYLRTIFFSLSRSLSLSVAENIAYTQSQARMSIIQFIVVPHICIHAVGC